MTSARPCLLLAIVLLISPTLTDAAPAPVRLKCQIDRSYGPPIFQVYLLDRAAGSVTAEPDSLFSAAGVAREGGKIVSVGYIDSWTDDELVLRTEYRSKDLPHTATITRRFDLKTLIETGEYRWSGPVRADRIAIGPNTCKREPLVAADR